MKSATTASKFTAARSESNLATNSAEAVRYYKLPADQGGSLGQWNDADCLAHGKGISANFIEAARYCQLVAGQGIDNAQVNHGLYPEHWKGVSMSLREPARHYKLAADQGDAAGQCFYVCTVPGKGEGHFGEFDGGCAILQIVGRSRKRRRSITIRDFSALGNRRFSEFGRIGETLQNVGRSRADGR